MKKVLAVNFLISVVLVVAAGNAAWAVEFKDGAEHNIDYTVIEGHVEVDYQAPGIGTAVNLLRGGRVSFLRTYNSSQATISGGEVPNTLESYDNSQVAMSDGWVDTWYAYDNSHAEIINGAITTGSVQNNSRFTMSGGQIVWLHAFDSSQLTMSGGWVDTFFPRGDSLVTTANFSSSDLIAQGNSQITISSIYMLHHPDSSEGGVLAAIENSRISINDGSLLDVVVSDYGRISIYGGSLQELFAQNNGQITFYGSNFAVDGIPVGPGEITSVLGGLVGDEPYRTLTGTLANGQIINNQFRIGNEASFVIVPEPASALLIGAGLVFIRKRR